MKRDIKKIFIFLFALIVGLSTTFLTVKKINNVKAEAVVNTPTINIQKYNLEYGSEVHILYALDYSGFDPNVNNVELLLWNTPQTEYKKGTEMYSKHGKLQNISNKDYIVFYSHGLAAKNMTDDIYARGYVKIDGKEYYSTTVKFSVLEYVYLMRRQGGMKESLSNLLDSMLIYGHNAQIEFNYKLDRLANDKYVYVHIGNAKFDDGFDYALLKPGTKHHITFSGELEMQPEYEKLITKDEQGEYYFTVPNNQNEVIINLKFHAWEKQYTYDDKYHWIKCTGCGEIKEKAPHILNEEGICSVCGKALPTEGITYEYDSSISGYNVTGYTGDAKIIRIAKTYNGRPVKGISNNAFNNKDLIEKVIIPEGVEVIGNSAFQDCANLHTVSIPTTVTQIGAYAFNYCMKLANVTLPSGITKIKDSTFYMCQALRNINFPEGLTEIEIRAFYCTGLEHIDFPSSLEIIGDISFYGCDNLVNLVVPEKVKTLGSETFKDCNALESVTLKGVETITGDAFFNDNSLVTLDISKCKSIGKDAFYGCIALNEIKFSNNLIEIGDSAFFNCDSIEQIILPTSLKTIGTNSFGICNKFKEVLYLGNEDSWNKINSNFDFVLNNILIFYYSETKPANYGAYWHYENGVPTKYNNIISGSKGLDYRKAEYSDYYELRGLGSCTDTEIFVSNYFMGKPVKAIAENAFSNNSTIKKITIPEGIDIVGLNAFSGCSALIELNCSASTISRNSFQNCRNLTTLNLTNNVRKIESQAFYGCSSLKSIDFPENINEINLDAFSYCSNLENVRLNGGLKIVGQAFNNCPKLKFNIYNNIKYLGNDVNPYLVLMKPENLNQTTYEINSNTKILANLSFANCTNLSSIIVPENVEYLGSSSFNRCENLEQITLSSKIKEIHCWAFNECIKLKEIILPDALEKIEYNAFTNCSGLTNLVFPDSTTQIAGTAFDGCTGLVSVKFGDLIEYAPSFSNSPNLKTIILGSNISSISENAYPNSKSIQNIFYKNQLSNLLSIYDVTSFKNSNIYFYSENTPTNLGTYWHYVNSEPIVYEPLLNYGSVGLKYLYNNVLNYFIVQGKGQCTDININIPATYNGIPVKEIDSSAFANDTLIESVIIPDGLLIINSNAFSKCTSLKKVQLSETVEVLDIDCFSNCSKLSEINLSKSLKKLGNSAFSYCTSLTKVVIPNGVTKLDSGVFLHCSSLETIEIPSSINYIDYFSIVDCKKLKNVYIEDLASWLNVTFNGNHNIFSYATNVTFNGKLVNEIIIPDQITKINDFAFSNLKLMTKLVINDNVTEIGRSAFSNCSSLQEVIVGSKVNLINTGAFSYCTKLIEIFNKSSLNLIPGDVANGNIAEHVKNIYTPTSGESKIYTDINGLKVFNDVNGKTLLGYTGTSPILEIPSDIKIIDSYALKGNEIITTLIINNGITTIKNNAFALCTNLEKVYLPLSLTSIETSAFNYCIKLTDIVLCSEISEIGSSAFYNCNSLTNIYFYGNITDRTNIIINQYNSGLNKKWYYYSETTPIDEGCYWHYVDNVPTKYETVYDGTAGLNYEISKDNSYVTLKGINSISNPDIIVAETYNGLPVEEIDFSGNNFNLVNSITIADNVNTLRNYGTETKIKKVTFGKGIQKINGIFNCNNYIETVILNANTKTIGLLSFNNCANLKEVVIPFGVETIESYVFQNCNLLQKIVIPSSVITINNNAFTNNKNLTIYCQVPSLPEGWISNWQEGNKEVIWNYQGV